MKNSISVLFVIAMLSFSILNGIDSFVPFEHFEDTDHLVNQDIGTVFRANEPNTTTDERISTCGRRRCTC